MTKFNTGRKIKLGLPSKRTLIHEFQACYMGLTIRKLESAHALQLADQSKTADEQYEAFTKTLEYYQFNVAALTCGFVCSDYNDFYPLEEAHSAPRKVISRMSLNEVRHYIHTLQQTMRWGKQFGETLWDAVSTGALGLVAQRIESDPFLYQIPQEEC